MLIWIHEEVSLGVCDHVCVIVDAATFSLIHNPLKLPLHDDAMLPRRCPVRFNRVGERPSNGGRQIIPLDASMREIKLQEGTSSDGLIHVVMERHPNSKRQVLCLLI